MLSSARRRPSSSHAANKQHLVGPRGAHVAPAWRDSAPGHRRPSGTAYRSAPPPPPPPPPAHQHSASSHEAGPSTASGDKDKRKLAPEGGSKILVSNLPEDVGETDVWDLFKSTVGPIKTLFLIYAANGRSRGMAFVHFHHPESAMKARNQYHGKVIDGTNAVRVELVSEPVPPPQTSLLARMNTGGSSIFSAPQQHQHQQQQQPRSLLDRLPPSGPRQQRPPQQHMHVQPQMKTGVQGKRKKGPKRVQNTKKTIEELDAEMEEWKNAAPVPPS
ncbi:RNA-binding domain-containing protein [Exidia glandulosa HHB12029]|uniref:RNA-binding domain-containing protein n=1 Tax=Exidia glandulosa HHB12029 TaxID=1314781 RepID=A0A165K6Y4_EXIGL|nr:RNA-binding domain-containing protein [Exidia glandulosa HHB12029]